MLTDFCDYKIKPCRQKSWRMKALRQHLHCSKEKNNPQRDVVRSENGGEVIGRRFGFARDVCDHALFQNGRNNDSRHCDHCYECELENPIGSEVAITDRSACKLIKNNREHEQQDEPERGSVAGERVSCGRRASRLFHIAPSAATSKRAKKNAPMELVSAANKTPGIVLITFAANM